jgi:uncharacterized membrane protein
MQQQFKKKIISGMFAGLAYFILFVVFGLIFYLSAIFIRDNDITITNSFSAVFLVIFGGLMAGYNMKQIPDIGLLKPTAKKLFDMINP